MRSALIESMVVDTGSSVTVLSDDLADRLALDLDSRAVRSLGGVTGLARCPFVREVEVFVGGLAAGVVRLPVAAIATPALRRSRGRLAPASWKGSLAGGSVSILGVDVARALRARLSPDFALSPR